MTRMNITRYSCMLSVGIMLLLGGNVIAQQVEARMAFSFPLSGEGYSIPFSYRADRAPSPVQIYNINSKYIVVSSLGFGAVCDIEKKGIFTNMQYPKDFLLNEGFYLVADNKIVTASFCPELSDIDTSDFKVTNHAAYTSISIPERYPFYLHGVFFFYDRNGDIVAIDKEKKLLKKDEVTENLLKLLEATPYANSSRKDIHRKLIRTGKYLIVDGIFYTSDIVLTQRYFESLGIKWKYGNRFSNIQSDYFLSKNSDEICGVALNGDTYFQSNNGIMVINQNGENIANISMKNVDQVIKNRNATRDDVGGKYSPTFYTLLPNGTLYAMIAIPGDDAYFFSASPQWGTDYIGLARNGISDSDVVKMRPILHSMNLQELRIVRNAFFALDGYDFQSWDLSSYFNGFGWYEKKAGVRSDISLLSENQKRLFLLIQAEEDSRK